MSPWERLIERPNARGHLVQFYSNHNECSLIRSVGRYLWEGRKRGDGLLVIATDEHCQALSRELDGLGAETESAIQDKRLLFLDARAILFQLMASGQPDWSMFETVVGAALREVSPHGDDHAPRAYGELVDLLWKARRFTAAIRLEQFWNKLLARSPFSLYCAYAIDIDKQFQTDSLDAVLCTHTHLLPGELQGKLETAIDLAIDDILGPKADNVRALIKADHQPSSAIMPRGETTILWLRKKLPEQAEGVIARARDYYQ